MIPKYPDRMRILYRRDNIRTVAKRWGEQYAGYSDPRKQRIHHELTELDLETCQASDVDEIIGNHSWTANDCSVCGQTFDVVLQIGDMPDYDALYVDICLQCLKDAMKYFKKAR